MDVISLSHFLSLLFLHRQVNLFIRSKRVSLSIMPLSNATYTHQLFNQTLYIRTKYKKRNQLSLSLSLPVRSSSTSTKHYLSAYFYCSFKNSSTCYIDSRHHFNPVKPSLYVLFHETLANVPSLPRMPTKTLMLSSIYSTLRILTVWRTCSALSPYL